MDVFTCEPHNDLLANREPNEAFCIAHPGREYAVFFPRAAEVTLDVTALDAAATLRWLHIVNSEWQPAVAVAAGATIEERCPRARRSSTELAELSTRRRSRPPFR